MKKQLSYTIYVLVNNVVFGLAFILAAYFYQFYNIKWFNFYFLATSIKMLILLFFDVKSFYKNDNLDEMAISNFYISVAKAKRFVVLLLWFLLLQDYIATNFDVNMPGIINASSKKTIILLLIGLLEMISGIIFILREKGYIKSNSI